MKLLALFLLATSISLAAELSTGQAARLLIGQTTFTFQESGASQTLVGGVGGIAYANDTLFVADSNYVGAAPSNNRVLIYKNLSTMLPKPTDILLYHQRCPVCVGTATVVLGQPDFTTTDVVIPSSNQTLRTPTAVATDGVRLAVADTDNNRILIWNSIPSTNQAPADIVVGQPDFQTTAAVRPPTASSLRGPQGVWLQGGKLYVADTFNNRVLIWNQIPAANGVAADIVLGQPDFLALPESDPYNASGNVKDTTMFSPVSVTSDGQRLYVTDLGFDRILIWNSIPTRTQQAADVVIGQPDMTTAGPNSSPKLCASTGTDDSGNALYPPRCGATLDTPRYALSDGQKLFITDGGGDRVLIFNAVPTTNGQAADVVLGQQTMEYNVSGSSDNPLAQSSSDTVRTPLSLAWDGTNLFVTDPFNRRIMVFSAADKAIPHAGVRNAASWYIYAQGSIGLGGAIQENDEVTVTIGDKTYVYKVLSNDTIKNVVTQLVNLINAGDGDPLVYAVANLGKATVLVVAKAEGDAGNLISYNAVASTAALITVAVSGNTLRGGQNSAQVAPGTLVEILGEGLSDETAVASFVPNDLPTSLGGVRVYFDGIEAPLLYVSPTQINAQIPFEVLDTTSLNAFVRIEHSDGSVSVTSPVAVPIILQNPGIFAFAGQEPRQAVALHFSSQATGTISVDGSVLAGDVGVVIVDGRRYSYTVQEADTLVSIMNGLIAEINNDPKVEAFSSGWYSRIRLRARVPGPEGNSIRIGADVSGTSLLLTPFNATLCCANVAGSLVTQENPALPGETIIVYATGLGLITPDEARQTINTGSKYVGPELNSPVSFVSSRAGDTTVNVLDSGLKPGTFSLYEIDLELNSSQPTDMLTPLTISQDVYSSNVVTVPVFNPSAP